METYNIFKMKHEIINCFRYLDFKRSMFFNKVYFGNYLSSCQVFNTRRKAMENLLSNELKNYKGNDFKIIEVGSWAGHSAILWASICKKYKKGKVFCIDTWEASSNATESMKYAVKKDKIMKLFLHNINLSGLKNYISFIRNSSDEAFKILKHNEFDFIYIDGDHSYNQFKKDLINYSKLLKVGGIICGDDLEMNPNNIDLGKINASKEDDWYEDKNVGFHYGIMLAIKEFFKDVSIFNGFWVVRKLNNGWEKIKLNKKYLKKDVGK